MHAAVGGVTCLTLAFPLAGGPRLQAQDVEGVAASAAFDDVLDTQVRDGHVYYRALKANRAPLDRYVASLAQTALPPSRNAQIAFWLNAYNAIVMRTVVDHYPIASRTSAYPAHSIKQIAGAFERTSYVVAGKRLTLDQIEQSILPAFRDPRVFLALGRGAVGGGRLRSEIYTAESLERQLDEQAAECASRDQCVHIDHATNKLQVSAIFSWRRTEFVEAYALQSGNAFATRSPIEKAVIAFISPRIVSTDRDVLVRNQFKVEYLPFDWSLNDLATRRR